MVSGWLLNSMENFDIPKSPTIVRELDTEQLKLLRDFFDSLPKVPSHYCRESSSKLYLEPLITTKKVLLDLYVSTSKQKGKKPMSIWSFSKVFQEMNLEIFHPKKDQCETCASFAAGNISDEEKYLHDLKKKEAKEDKNSDKILAKDNFIHCLTADLQALKQSPISSASCIYFKCKLNVHNYTIYNLGDQSASCYWWHEGEGDLTTPIFTSCLMDYIKLFDDSKPIIIWSDGCTYQNRNAYLSNALLNFAMKTGKIIYQKYLEVGHTQMECDSVHSAIEQVLKYKEIKLPSDYVTLTKLARQKNPYTAHYLTHDFFKDYTQHQRYSSIRPGSKPGDPVVVDIRAIKYDPVGKIFYKLRHSADWSSFPENRKTFQLFQNINHYLKRV